MSNINLLRSEAAARKARVSVSHYDVELDLSQAADLSVPGFSSRTTINFSANSTAGTFLDFIGLSVESVRLNGQELNVSEVVDAQRIKLPILAPENEVVVTATAAYSSSGEGLHRFVDPADGQTYTYTQYEPADARRVFANFEQPDLKSPYTFHVTAPNGWEVASNQSVALKSIGADATRWDFDTTLPISTYITTVLAGPYFKAEDHFSMSFGTSSKHHGETLDIPLAAYCRASLAPNFDSAEIFQVTKAGLAYFNELFDFPYPFGKYDQAFVPEYNLGAMENPGLVTFTEAYVFTSRATDSAYQKRANTIMHEMAHMWFGDLVTMGWWDDLWLKESFADFMGHLAVSEATPWGSKSWTLFASSRKAWAYTQDQLPTTHPITADIPDLEAAKANFDGITYAKGASVLKQLVAYVGKDAFFAGAREYFVAHQYANTSLTDLLTPLSAASGRELGEWAQKWLQTSGMSTLTPRLDIADGKIASLEITQLSVDPITGLESLRPHRLAVGFFTNDGGTLVRTHSITLDVAGSVTQVPGAAGLPAPDLVLVNDEDLSYAKVRFDDVSLASALASVSTIADPLSRSLVWSVLWNATRDALLPAELYLNAVAHHGGGESDISLLQTLADNAIHALGAYCPAGKRAAAREHVITGFRAHLSQSVPGSDEQLVWTRALAVVGRGSDTQVASSRALLAGVDVPEGLSVDGELRWLLWQQLAARGQATSAELDAELAANTTAEFRAHHVTAVAALPEAERKAQAWQEAVEQTKLSNQLLSATIAGFMMAGAELLDPYVEPYFEVLEKIWAERSLGIAGRIVRELFPAHQDLLPGALPEQQPVLVRTDRWLAEHATAANGLRRIILEQRDQLHRSLRAQALQR
ncbi:aminopeptidase N [Arthrobacter psychrolactophilus]|uniref:Aminopeptidase N n=1 Tax=Arthrobacter psychrolactophilus TaxID=92442 RepID=A0A2V5IPD7_9MICC|nr:aminopeptidase N [Arthrobacter psychrolactophilus]PYI38425.1 aminopeptidase N [Arthrobacter psychrolactophilus]